MVLDVRIFGLKLKWKIMTPRLVFNCCWRAFCEHKGQQLESVFFLLHFFVVVFATYRAHAIKIRHSLALTLASVFLRKIHAWLTFRFRVFYFTRIPLLRSPFFVWLHCVHKKHIFQREFFRVERCSCVGRGGRRSQGWPTERNLSPFTTGEAEQFRLRASQSAAESGVWRRKNCLNQRWMARGVAKYPLASRE